MSMQHERRKIRPLNSEGDGESKSKLIKALVIKINGESIFHQSHLAHSLSLSHQYPKHSARIHFDFAFFVYVLSHLALKSLKMRDSGDKKNY